MSAGGQGGQRGRAGETAGPRRPARDAREVESLVVDVHDVLQRAEFPLVGGSLIPLESLSARNGVASRRIEELCRSDCVRSGSVGAPPGDQYFAAR